MDVEALHSPEHVHVKQFYQAILDQNCTQIADIVLKQLVSINHIFKGEYVQHWHSGWAMIHIVSETKKISGKHNEELFELAVDLGADIMLANKNGDLAIHIACKASNVKAVQRLLELNPNCKDVKNLHGLTPLIRSLYHYNMQYKDRNLKMVKALVDASCDVNLGPDSGVSPLHVAVEKDAKITEKLIRAGANVNFLTNQGESPLMKILCGNMYRIPHETLRILLEAGADVTVTNASGRMPLHIAVSKSDDISVNLLLQHGANPNAPDNFAITPMWLAVDEHAMKLLPILVAKGGDLNFKSPVKKKSLITLAVANEDSEMVALLLKLGAVITDSMIQEQNIMFYALKSKSYAIVKALLYQNYPLNKPTYCSPMTMALKIHNLDILKLFMLAGAKYDIDSVLPKEDVHLDDSFKDFFHEHCCQASSLRSICCFHLRKTLGLEIKKKLQDLVQGGHIPQSLSSDVMLENVLS